MPRKAVVWSIHDQYIYQTIKFFKNIYKKIYAPVPPALRPVFSIVKEGHHERLKQLKFPKESTWVDIKDYDQNSLVYYAEINAGVTKDKRILDSIYDLVQTNFSA